MTLYSKITVSGGFFLGEKKSLKRNELATMQKFPRTHIQKTTQIQEKTQVFILCEQTTKIAGE
jgi:hypothetical protein